MGVLRHKRELDREDIERMNLPKSLWGSNFHEIAPSAQTWVRNYLLDIEENMRKGVSLMIYGAGGTGKSQIASFLAKYVLSYGSSVYWTSAWAYREAKRRGLRFSDEVLVADRALAVDLLVFDDISEEDLADKFYGEGEIKALVRHRASHGKATFLTCEQLLAPIVRAVTMMASVEVTGEDQRLSKKREIFDALYAGVE